MDNTKKIIAAAIAILIVTVCFYLVSSFFDSGRNRDPEFRVEETERMEISGYTISRPQPVTLRPGTRGWGPEQAVGEADTNGYGDIQTAWASATPDGQEEWLLLEYNKAVIPEQIMIMETYNPGAVFKVCVFNQDGDEIEVWAGKDPTPVTNDGGISHIKVKTDLKVNKVKIYLDSVNVPGWNEIDAVALKDTSGNVQWASDAQASSSYAERSSPAKRNPLPHDTRPWGPEQAVGQPDTPGAGDLRTAWASATPDGQEEWLILEYNDAVMPAKVVIHETYNPGAVFRVSVFNQDGDEIEAWSGNDPTPAGSERGISEIMVAPGFSVNKIKIYLDSANVPGWNEIDAVGLMDTSDNIQWAADVKASTTYAER